jgi:hypothetical protein
MMNSVNASETSVSYEITRRSVPEGCHLQYRYVSDYKLLRKHVQRDVPSPLTHKSSNVFLAVLYM